MLQKAFKEEALSCTQVFEWFAWFKRGELSVEDHPHSGRLSTSRTDKNVVKIREKINADRQYTTDEISEATAVSWSSCRQILTVDLNMRRVATKFVPCLLTQDQKNTRMTLCQELKNQIESNPNFLSKVITGDKSWCYGYEPETKQASSQWKTPTSPRLKKARQVRSNAKTMLIVFFEVRGIVHREFIPPGQTVNQEYYLEVLRRLRENVQRKRPELWRSGNWFLYHDNAPAHTALSVIRYLASLGWTVVPHPPITGPSPL